MVQKIRDWCKGTSTKRIKDISFDFLIFARIKNLRIGINTLAVVPSEIGGALTYVQKLIENLARIDRENEYFLFLAPWNQKLFKVKKRNFRQIICNVPFRTLPLRILYEQAVLPVLAWKNKIDVFHSPASVSPFLLFCPSVLTLHDVVPFIFPKLTPLVFRLYWDITYRISARKAQLVIAVSHSDKEDLIKFLDIGEKKITVIYHGSEQPNLEIEDEKGIIAFQKKKESDAPYILWVGRMYRHKNLTRLLYAYNKLIKTHQGIKHQLVLCGMRAWEYSSFTKTVKELVLEDKVIFKGYVPDDVLKSIYANASLFVFPSLTEGFGFPILEAMSCGIPVVTSNCGAMAEVAGNAALLVDPYSVGEIAETMHKVLTDETLRATLIKKGLERAKEFSWERTARETLSVYEKARGRE